MDKLTKTKEYKDKENSIEITLIPVDQISPDPEQVRKEFEEKSLKELAVSIKKEGVIVPLIVYPKIDEERYVIIAGERRYRASKLASLSHLPCIVRREDLSNQKKKSIQLIENLQRQDLTAIEIAKGLSSLQKENLTQKQLGEAIGLNQSMVSRYLAIFDIKEEWLKKIENDFFDASLKELYGIAKEKNGDQKSLLYKKLMAKKGKTVETVNEEKEVRKKISQFTNEELEKIWSELKKISKKDKHLLVTYIKPSKLKQILASCNG